MKPEPPVTLFFVAMFALALSLLTFARNHRIVIDCKKERTKYLECLQRRTLHAGMMSFESTASGALLCDLPNECSESSANGAGSDGEPVKILRFVFDKDGNRVAEGKKSK